MAINSRGKVGFMYQQLTGTGSAQRWETHLELTDDDFATSSNFILATVPSNTPAPAFLPYMGDYEHLMAVGKDFYGIFATANIPDLANFPNGVSYLRNADFTTHSLLGTDGIAVIQPSIDPFFVKVTEISTTLDFYVRDWTDNATSHDIGLNPRLIQYSFKPVTYGIDVVMLLEHSMQTISL